MYGSAIVSLLLSAAFWDRSTDGWVSYGVGSPWTGTYFVSPSFMVQSGL